MRSHTEVDLRQGWGKEGRKFGKDQEPDEVLGFPIGSHVRKRKLCTEH